MQEVLETNKEEAQRTCQQVTVLLTDYFKRYDQVAKAKAEEVRLRGIRRTTLENYMATASKSNMTGFQRMLQCRWLSNKSNK